jgi:hypothetical protein
LSRYATRVATVVADRIVGGTVEFPPLVDSIEIVRRESV